MASKLLSKSKYLNGIQCPRLLWFSVNCPSDMPEPDAATQHIFDQGHLVGELAKKLFPEGIDVPQESFIGNIQETKKMLNLGKPLFEAAVMFKRLYARSDILYPANDYEWDIIEVKSSTSVKDINIHDLAFQKFCWEISGLKIRKTILVYINNEYIKNGEIIPEELFTLEDVSDAVQEIYGCTEEKIVKMLQIMNLSESPEIYLGSHCNDPYPCALIDNCWGEMPEDNVFTLYYGGKKSAALYDSGIMEIGDIPDGFTLSDKQLIQKDSVVNNNVHIQKDEIKDFLNLLEYPLYYLDFETFNTAVPIYDGTRPYQQIPFQFSLHVQESPNTELKHYWYLAEGNEDPRLGFITALYELIGNNGTVVAYNKCFEEKILKSLGEAFPKYQEWVDLLLPRFIDLWGPFRSFYYYHPEQRGSTSLKKVLPSITDISYDGMEIAQGDDASLAFLQILFGDLTDAEKDGIRENLLKYCERDTEAMAEIIAKLYRLAE
ncbi:MAG: DUF2779 domain-containing protein [Dehalococcoidales bacterium]